MIGPGTLPGQGVDRMDMLRYAEWISGRKPLKGDELLAALPEIGRIAKVEVDDKNPYPIDSAKALQAIAARMEAVARRPEVGGIVFVQGTNSIEETSYFLNLTVHTNKPIVVTGAQRPFTALGSDGPLNLIDAIRVAASSKAHRIGVLVVANSEINAARDVTKTTPTGCRHFAAAISAFSATWISMRSCSTARRCGATRSTANSTFQT